MTSEKTQNPRPDHLVIVGSSAGGIEALSILVSTLPTDFPAAIVLAQHLDPRRHSNLGQILQRHTSLPVKVIGIHTRLQAGEIYVVPENRHVTVSDGFISAREDHPGRPKPSIDLLLSSAAKMYGERLIMVILTGSGSNGARGAMEVKQAGGTVIIQNPETARFPSMPLALPPTIVDLQVDLERIGPLLYDLLKGRYDRSKEELAPILTYLKNQTHIDFQMYATPRFLRHLRYRMIATRISTTGSYLDYLKSTPSEVEDLLEGLRDTHTHFFYDPEAFAYLKSTILPELITRGRNRGQTLRCWSAGCATGEDAYALAMLLADLLGQELSWWSIKIFATDLAEASINFARHGLYPDQTLKLLPAGYKERFFEHVEHGYRVMRQLRQTIVFGQQNLAQAPPFSALDLIVCRNTLRYFTPDAQALVLRQFAFSLFPDGYLLLGKGEGAYPASSQFEQVSQDWNVYRCISNVAPSTKLPMQSRARGPYLEHPTSTLPQRAKEQSIILSHTLDPELFQRYNELLVRTLPIGLVTIDHNYHILTANSTAHRLLQLPHTLNEQDFLHAVPGMQYSQIRSGIDAAIREHRAITLPEVELDTVAGGNGRTLAFSITPLQLQNDQPELIAISIIDITEHIQVQRRLEAAEHEKVMLVNELGAANKRLNEANKALLKSNEELQDANENMILAQEELHATLQELETTNETLQADIEELTVNEAMMQATSQEFETRNEELQVTNETLITSVHELQDQNAQLTNERRELTEIINHAPFSLVVLHGPDMRIKTLSSHDDGYHNKQHLLGRPLANVEGDLWPADLPLVHLINEVYQQNVSRHLFSNQVSGQASGDGKEQSYQLYTLVPSHNADGTVSGVIIYITSTINIPVLAGSIDQQIDEISQM